MPEVRVQNDRHFGHEASASLLHFKFEGALAVSDFFAQSFSESGISAGYVVVFYCEKQRFFTPDNNDEFFAPGDAGV
jgi:hypothetical protein